MQIPEKYKEKFQLCFNRRPFVGKLVAGLGKITTYTGTNSSRLTLSMQTNSTSKI